MKRIESLTPEDFTSCPVWEYVRSGGILGGDSMVKEVTDEVITHLRSRVVGTYVALNNSGVEFCVLGNLDLNAPV